MKIMAVSIPNQRQKIYKDGGLTVTLEFPRTLGNELELQYGIGSPLQKFWDNMLLTDINNYVFTDTGTLRQSSTINTVIGSGELVWKTPYARFLYNGLVMIDPDTGSPFARQGVSKVTTERELTSQAGGITGAHWADRAANDLMDTWIANSQAWISGRT